MTELRTHLSDWLDRARAGGEVVITNRGIPVARLAALDNAGTLERLTTEGVIGKATAHLASALAVGDPGLIVAVWDRRLHTGAHAAGCRVAPANLADRPPNLRAHAGQEDISASNPCKAVRSAHCTIFRGS